METKRCLQSKEPERTYVDETDNGFKENLLVQNEDFDLPSDEEYLKTFLSDSEYAVLISLLKNPRYGVYPNDFRNFKRKYPLEKLKELFVVDSDAAVDTSNDSNDVITRNSGAYISDKKFTKALLVDKELCEIAGMLTFKSYHNLYEIQQNYTLDYLKSLRAAFRNYKSGVETITFLKEMLTNSLIAIPEPPEISRNSSLKEIKMELKRTKRLNHIKQLILLNLGNGKRSDSDVDDALKDRIAQLDATPEDPEEDTDEVFKDEAEKTTRFEAMKNRRDKKIKETNNVVDEVAPGYVGNQSLDDILKHIESKPENNGKTGNSGGKKKAFKSEEKKEVVPVKDKKNRTKNSPVELLCNKSTEKKELVTDDVVPKTNSNHRSFEDKLNDLPHDSVVEEHLLESPANTATIQNHLMSHSLAETIVDPAENAIYGQVLKYYNMDKEKENDATSSSLLHGDTPKKLDSRSYHSLFDLD